MPADDRVRSITRQQMLIAFRQPTAIGVATKLNTMLPKQAQSPGIGALGGTGEFELVAEQIVRDLKAYSESSAQEAEGRKRATWQKRPRLP